MTTWSDAVSAVLKGPGWFPGTDRLGDISFIAEVVTVLGIYDQQCV